MKKHFMATHTWTSKEARDKVIEMNSGMTEEEFFSSLKTEKAETLQHWMGKDDFFFCHWYAESEDAIIEALEKVGFNDLIVTMPNEMQRYISIDKLSGKPLVNPFDED
tara:strand:- start:1137 stop:1460 length:324 start_codon:yes stop_codon:yes gene_type:complete